MLGRLTNSWVLVPAIAVFSITANAERAIQVISEDFGEAWPLTVYSGVVNCIHGGHAIFIHESGIYAMNGIAKDHAKKRGYLNIRKISKPHPKYPEVEADIQPLLKLALRNC